MSLNRHSARMKNTNCKNRLHIAVSNWFLKEVTQLACNNHTSLDSLLGELPSSYTIYKPLLLLPAHTFTGKLWSQLLKDLPESSSKLLYGEIAHAMGVTHIARNAPIPLEIASRDDTQDTRDSRNIMRSPIGLVPLYGDFGLANCNEPQPSDFDKAFWVSTTQNGIVQVWAPLYTMFSRGNVKEKTRLLQLESVGEASEDGARDGRGWTAVDLYAGIGYFAFSYVKAGTSKVLCWELNPWSVEGLRRGAEANRWRTEIVHEREELTGELRSADLEESQLIVFSESNCHAAERINLLREHLPPVHHVNCGLLPTSEESWSTAVAVLDHVKGGWIHVHENVALADIEERSQEIQKILRGMIERQLSSCRSTKGSLDRSLQLGRLCVQHVERVKSYAPGVWHCVFDVQITWTR